MNYKEITDLVKLLQRLEIAEFKMKQGDLDLQIRTKGYKKVVSSGESMAPMMVAAPTPMAAPLAQAAPPSQADLPPAPAAKPITETASTANLVEIKSPMVGTFYRSSSPDKPPYVKVGDSVAQGDTVCIVEAMKLFNEIESEVSGKIVKVMIEDASPVEYDQVLFLVDPKG